MVRVAQVTPMDPLNPSRLREEPPATAAHRGRLTNAPLEKHADLADAQYTMPRLRVKSFLRDLPALSVSGTGAPMQASPLDAAILSEGTVRVQSLRNESIQNRLIHRK